VTFPAQPGYPLDFLNAHKIDRGYDLSAGRDTTIGLKSLCNLLVHSFVFIPATDDRSTGWTGFFLNSDRTRNKELLFIASEDFDVLVDEVIRDDVSTMHVDRIGNSITKSRAVEGEPAVPISLNAITRRS
jgi:hypothetical protein